MFVKPQEWSVYIFLNKKIKRKMNLNFIKSQKPKKLFTIGLFLIFSVGAFAQNAEIYGVVKDGMSNDVYQEPPLQL
jgi:hypothetical protein